MYVDLNVVTIWHRRFASTNQNQLSNPQKKWLRNWEFIIVCGLMY